MKRFCTWIISTLLALSLAPLPARADPEIHEQVKHSLAQLVATGTARIGPALGSDITSSGTGFFVGTDGYILTTAHLFDPLKDANAANTKITARFEGTGTGTVEVLYVSELASLDLVLLRAIVSNGIAVPPSLEIGDSKDVDLGSPELLTSGFDLTGYRKKSLELNSTSNRLANFAWTLNGKSNSGASGSPVYIGKDGAPLVVGILKATAVDDDELSLMIPVEYSFQLVGQFKMQELIEEVARLQRIVDEIPGVKPPLNDRVDNIEKSVEQIKGSFTWTAEADDRTGALIIQYHKIVSDGPQVEEISVKIQPNTYVADGNNPNIRAVQPGLTWSAITQPRSSLAPEERTGTFILPDIRRRLTDVILNSDGTFKDEQPFRDIELKISAKSGDTVFQTKLSIVPRFTWIYDTE